MLLICTHWCSWMLALHTESLPCSTSNCPNNDFNEYTIEKLGVCCGNELILFRGIILLHQIYLWYHGIAGCSMLAATEIWIGVPTLGTASSPGSISWSFACTCRLHTEAASRETRRSSSLNGQAGFIRPNQPNAHVSGTLFGLPARSKMRGALWEWRGRMSGCSLPVSVYTITGLLTMQSAKCH